MPEREIKSLDFTNIKAAAKGRERSGIAAVFGNIDAVGDRIMPGAFARTIAGGAKRARFLWNHSYQHPPVASIKELRELTRDELPPEVLEKAPEATGGLLVRREYYKGVDLADWLLAAIDNEDINEMSFAYEIVRSSRVTEPIPGDETEKTRDVNELHELKLFDCSDVLWGCNAATIAAGAKDWGLMPLGVIASQLAMLESEIKAGRRNSDSDQKLVDLIHNTAVSLGAACGSDEEDAGKHAQPPQEKSEPAEDSTSLSPNDWLEILKAKSQALVLSQTNFN
jgi:HK97 family phage prohead protease